MNEAELLARLREEIPLEEASPESERLFLAGLEDAPSGLGTMGRWRKAGRPHLGSRLALTGGLSAALAAAVAAVVVVAVPHPGGGRSAIRVRELAYRAAAAAERQPAVRPGQWVYWKESTREGWVYWKESRRWVRSSFQVWVTADATKAAFVAHGKVHFIHFPMRGPQFLEQPEVHSLPGGGTVTAAVKGTITVKYTDLGSLPHSPEALLRYLANLPHRSGWGSAFREFTIIEELITTYVMPPRLTAELYRALGHIPGVTVDDHATDVAGRHGVGFISPAAPGGGNDEIILNPHTYHLMGHDELQLQYGVAYLRVALVSGPGVMP
jgi:hypothetical protein